MFSINYFLLAVWFWPGLYFDAGLWFYLLWLEHSVLYLGARSFKWHFGGLVDDLCDIFDSVPSHHIRDILGMTRLGRYELRLSSLGLFKIRR